MEIPALIIGGGLSGIAAGIRTARFIPDVLILEQHTIPGGLNSYFYRSGELFETGLHAITNYAEPGDKSAPLNRLLRQLKLDRRSFTFCQQLESEILFTGLGSLRFSNDFQLLEQEVRSSFPRSIDGFIGLTAFINEFDPFANRPFRSAKSFLLERLKDPLLVDMLLCPLMYYGSSHENDMDLGQFAIMFRAIYLEGMWRPAGSIKDFLQILLGHYKTLGGKLRTGCRVERIIHKAGKVLGVETTTGEFIACRYLLSTIGADETQALLEKAAPQTTKTTDRLGFIETIYRVKKIPEHKRCNRNTILFYNNGARFRYQNPQGYLDTGSGVICLPQNFAGLSADSQREIRSTHLANYTWWKELYPDTPSYRRQKRLAAAQSREVIEEIIGPFTGNIVFEDSFTPVTIERYTRKKAGAIYGSPQKIKDGDIGFQNLFVAGTDQGFLGIVGSMLSGVSIVNQHILPHL